jgi:hypothetical protein
MWTKEEDQIILDTWRAEGPKWTFIANKLPGRSVIIIFLKWIFFTGKYGKE